MKFLVIMRNKDSYYTFPPEKQMEIATGAIAVVDKYLKAGKLKDIYYHIDLMGSVSIWEVESSEEAARINLENPMLHFADIERIPLVEYDVGKKLRMEALEKAAKK